MQIFLQVFLKKIHEKKFLKNLVITKSFVFYRVTDLKPKKRVRKT